MAKEKAQSHKLYSITVSGQGDTFISLVTKEVWDWVQNPLKVKVPQDVIDYHVKEEGEPDWEPYISNTKGKPNGCTINDAALSAPGAKIGRKRASFVRMSEFTKFVQKHNIKIMDEWEGYIY